MGWPQSDPACHRATRPVYLALGLATLGVLVALGLASVTPGPAAAASPIMAVRMLDGVNQVRADAGLAPLADTDPLDAVAADRSADMVTRHYFSHTTPDGLDVFALLDRRGISFAAAGENLAWTTYGDEKAAASALDGFLGSPPHRANLLDPAYREIGVGVARDGGTVYFTLVFVG
jgi:uncharacterized protein YkwD